MKRHFFITSAAAILTVSPTLFGASPSSAQTNNTSQLTPASEAPGAAELRDALRQIARNRSNVEALINAGNASLKLNDPASAMNFFRKAEALRPGDGRIKAGIGGAMVRMENPFGALRYFDQAAKLGVSARNMAFDRGLAFDLLGNFERAQQDYEQAAGFALEEQLLIRHAISLSLSGKATEADAKLNPLLTRNVPAAWRARAFMLAARGEFNESREVVRGFLDARSAQRMERYLRQMPRLTSAQQAAAIHLGHFPADNIGRDSDDVRSASANIPVVDPDPNRLTPAGRPLGSGAQSGTSTPVRTASLPPSTAQLRIASAALAARAVKAVPQIVPAKQTSQPPIVAVATNDLPKPGDTQPSTNAPAPGFEAVAKAEAPVAAANSNTGSASSNAPRVVDVSGTAVVTDRSELPIPTNVEQKTAQATPPKETAQPDTEPPKTAVAATTSGSSTSRTPSFSLDDIVSSIEIPESEKKKPEKLVDLNKLPPPPKPQSAFKPATKEKAATAQQDQANEVTKASYWVQIATGNKSSMTGEYRRLSKKYSDLFEGQRGWTSPWSERSRLVVGPFDGFSSAREWYQSLKEAGGDGFVWNSSDGTKVTALKKK